MSIEPKKLDLSQPAAGFKQGTDTRIERHEANMVPTYRLPEVRTIQMEKRTVFSALKISPVKHSLHLNLMSEMLVCRRIEKANLISNFQIITRN